MIKELPYFHYNGIKRTAELTYFYHNDKEIPLKKPIPIEITHNKNHVYAVNNDLEISGHGTSEMRAIESVRENLSGCYTLAKKLVELVETE